MRASSLPDRTSFPTFWINHASRALTGRFEERLRPLGLGTAYLPVLWALEEGPMRQKELLERVPITQPTMTALLNRMERDGLLTRATNPEDRRAQFVTLTERARAALPQMALVLQETMEEALAGISDDDRQRLMNTLKEVVRNIGSVD